MRTHARAHAPAAPGWGTHLMGAGGALTNRLAAGMTTLALVRVAPAEGVFQERKSVEGPVEAKYWMRMGT